MALGRGRDRYQVAQVSDAPVSVSDEMRDALPDAGLVVGKDAIRVEKGGRPVDEDHRRSGSTLAEEIAVVVAGGHDDQPIDASGGEGRDELLFTGLVFVGTSGEHQNPTLEGDVFDFAVQS